MRKARTKSGYVNIMPVDGVCLYCGASAYIEDHALPYSYKDDVSEQFQKVLVFSCEECNAILSNSVQHTLGERIRVAKQRLARRYSKTLAIPSWSIQELCELEENMRDYVFAGLQRKQWVEQRLAFDYFVWVKLGKPQDMRPSLR